MKRLLRLIMKTNSKKVYSACLASLIALMGLTGNVSGESALSDPAAFDAQQRAASDADQMPDTFRQAKNVILFIGDGMGISTVTAARILEGQQRGESGEENTLFFESFPYSGLAKTYAVNMQTPDSAATMTAMMSGHKTKGMVVGYDANIVAGDHTSASEFGGPSKRLMSLLERFEIEGKSTGIVTTTSVTHATPASCYAHSPSRMWECGNYLKPSLGEKDERYELAMRAGFKDIAQQLVTFPFGDGIDVILGGGRRGFLPAGLPGADGKGLSKGRRIDGRNLIEEWAYSVDREYVSTRGEMLELDATKSGQVMGLFAWNHLEYEAVASSGETEREEPSLHEMGVLAVDRLRANSKGFFLMVEGGRIDHGHHLSNAKRALTETIEFDRAVKAIYERLSPAERAETLIVVTADHSHTFTMGGYPTRGNPILGKVRGVDRAGEPQCQHDTDAVGLPYTTLGYQNGGGFVGMMVQTNTLEHAHGPKWPFTPWKYAKLPREVRPDLTEIDTAAMNYRQESTVPMMLETHSGEDVSFHATGPGSHLFRGTREQNYLYHAMVQAMGRR